MQGRELYFHKCIYHGGLQALTLHHASLSRPLYGALAAIQLRPGPLR